MLLWDWFEYDVRTGEWHYQQALKGETRGKRADRFLAAVAVVEYDRPAVFRRITPIIHVAAASLGNAGELFGQIQIMCGAGDSVRRLLSAVALTCSIPRSSIGTAGPDISRGSRPTPARTKGARRPSSSPTRSTNGPADGSACTP